jgi:hypothetical protein
MEMHSEKVTQGSREAYDDLNGLGQFFTGLTTAERATTSFQHQPHVRNFVDCLKTREKPVGDIEIGHHSTATCLIGNIALRTGEKLQWDGAKEQFKNSAKANEMLRREYRKPWSLAGL